VHGVLLFTVTSSVFFGPGPGAVPRAPMSRRL
jgi:hypothetical protein